MPEKLNPLYEKKKKQSRALKIFSVVAGVIAVITAVYVFVFRLEEVTYTGNKYYSEEELNEMLLSDGMSWNSLYVLVKFGLIFNPDYPYIENVAVRMESPSHLHIDVSEKVVVGCVDCSGTYMYFDAEGMIIDSAARQFGGVPLIEGYSFENAVFGEKLSMEDERTLDKVINMAVMLSKHKIKAEKVAYDEDGKATLYIGNVRVELGKDTNLKMKLVDLPRILPSLAGKAGVLHMENYSADSDSVTFTEDKEPDPPPAATEPASGEEGASGAEPAGEEPLSSEPSSAEPQTTSPPVPSSAVPSQEQPSFEV